MLHLQSNFYILFCHKISLPLYAPTWVLTTKPSTIKSEELLSTEMGVRVEEEEEMKKGGRKRGRRGKGKKREK